MLAAFLLNIRSFQDLESAILMTLPAHRKHILEINYADRSEVRKQPNLRSFTHLIFMQAFHRFTEKYCTPILSTFKAPVCLITPSGSHVASKRKQLLYFP